MNDMSKTPVKNQACHRSQTERGTLITRPPFGYRRNEKDKTVLEIVPKEAEYIKQIYDLYLSGSGYRKIATYLTEQGAPTPL